jgi:hypothetical protein
VEQLAVTQTELDNRNVELEELKKKNIGNEEVIARIQQEIDDNESKRKANQAAIHSLIAQKVTETTTTKSSGQTGGNDFDTEPSGGNTGSSQGNLVSNNKYVYAVLLDDLVWELPTGEKTSTGSQGFIGTGFILSDGRFVTARHVVEPWYYYPYLGAAESTYRKINYCAFNRGKVFAKYTIVSPTGRRYSFTNEQIICNRANDIIAKEAYGLDLEAIVRTAPDDRYDWAFFQTDEPTGLRFDNQLSLILEQSEQLEILGYPRGIGAEDINNLKPTYSTCVTSRKGVDANGWIRSSNDDTSSGSSGSPVFAKRDNSLIVVGIVSGQNKSKGVIIPIREVLN